jgi:hypothetical protein
MVVGVFRESLARWPDSTAGAEVLEKLMRLPDFQPIWSAYEVRLHPSPDEYFRPEPWELAHPSVGALRIHRIAMTIPTLGFGTLVLSSPADAATSSKFGRLIDADRPALPHLFLVPA